MDRTAQITPMLARLEEAIPTGEGWLYEPKWDGFRALVDHEGGELRIISRNGQPLERYFPELLTELREVLPDDCLVDGEIIIEGPGGLDFDALLQRIHPAASRIARLARETPASFVAFDLVRLGGRDLRDEPFEVRRRMLEKTVRASPRVFVTAQTESIDVGRRWFDQFEAAGLDGLVAKRREQRYIPGERVMVKVKHERTADCVVGGYRLLARGSGVGSLLLGLYDDEGVLNYAGHTSGFSAKERRDLLAKLKPLEGGESFGEGRAPGGPSRWNRGRDTSWVSLEPKLVGEVAFDRLQGPRFRHAARFLRWRPDKNPRDCRYDQFGRGARAPLDLPRMPQHT